MIRWATYALMAALLAAAAACGTGAQARSVSPAAGDRSIPQPKGELAAASSNGEGRAPLVQTMPAADGAASPAATDAAARIQGRAASEPAVSEAAGAAPSAVGDGATAPVTLSASLGEAVSGQRLSEERPETAALVAATLPPDAAPPSSFAIAPVRGQPASLVPPDVLRMRPATLGSEGPPIELTDAELESLFTPAEQIAKTITVDLHWDREVDRWYYTTDTDLTVPAGKKVRLTVRNIHIDSSDCW